MAKLEDELEIARNLAPDTNEAGVERCYWHLRDNVCHSYCKGFKEGCEDYELTSARVFQLEAEVRGRNARAHEAEKGGDKRGELEKTLNIEGGNGGIGGGYSAEAVESPTP